MATKKGRTISSRLIDTALPFTHVSSGSATRIPPEKHQLFSVKIIFTP
jgi:hypothetical protein